MSLSPDETTRLQYFEKHRTRMLEELLEFLRIPSISTSPEHKPDLERCAKWLVAHLENIGITQTKIYETPGHPIVYAEYLVDESLPTYLLYGHYDVQPPDPLDEWLTPPFEPTIRDDKIFARGATDDKGQLFCHIKGIEAHLATKGTLPVNLKILFEGEEEIGSPSLNPWVQAQAEMLSCDAVIVSDSSMYGPGKPSICYGLRGLAYFEIEVQGPGHDLHSGLFGGSIENPINALASIISKLKADDGTITIPGFYDNVRELSSVEEQAFRDLKFDNQAFLEETGSPELHGEPHRTTLERVWSRPTLDCNGIMGGFTEKGAKTVLPAKAMAKFSCRLVPDQTCKEIEEKVVSYIEKIAPSNVNVRISLHHGGDPVIIERDHPAIVATCRALKKSWDTDALFIRGGGSIPVAAIFDEALKVPTVFVGLGLDDDRLHSPNEKFNLECFYGGIKTSLFLWTELADI